MITTREDIYRSTWLGHTIGGHQTSYRPQSFGDYIQSESLPICIDGSCRHTCTRCDRVLRFKAYWSRRHKGEFERTGIGAAIGRDLSQLPSIGNQPDTAERNRRDLVRHHKMSLHRAGVGHLNNDIYRVAIMWQDGRCSAATAERIEDLNREWPFKYLLEGNDALVRRLYRIFLHRVGEGVLRQLHKGVVYRQVRTIHHLHRHCASTLQAEVMRNILTGTQEYLLPCDSTGDRITHCDRVCSFGEYLGKLEMTAGIRLYRYVSQRPVRSDFNTGSGGRDSIRQEHIAGEHAGN